MKVLVTGAAGLIGFNACKYYLELGHQVVGIDNLERSDLLGHTEASDKRRGHNWHLLSDLGVETEMVDVSDKYDMDTFMINHPYGFDLIIHLAGQCGVPTSIKNPRRDFEINAGGTFNVLEYVRLTGKGRVVYASTNKTYPLHSGWALNTASDKWQWVPTAWRENGFPRHGELSHPDHLGGSRTPYGTSKYVGDLLMQEYYHTYGIPTGVFRMSCIYGPNQMGFEEQGWVAWFIIAALKGLPLTIYGDGRQVRDILYVGDLLTAYDAFATSSSVMHGVWNIGGGPNHALSLNECIEFLQSELNLLIPVEYKDWRPSDQRIYTSDLRPLKADLGWSPTTSPKTGLRDTLAWVKDNLDLF